MAAVIPDSAAVLRGVTEALLPLKFLPAAYWLYKELHDLFNVQGWTSPLDFFINIYTTTDALWTSIGVWMQMFSFLPLDLFIQFETFILPDTNKVNDLATQTYLRIFSWFLVAVFGGEAIYYGSAAIYHDIVTGPLSDVMAMTVVKTLSAILALAPAVTYLFQVNAYANYLF